MRRIMPPLLIVAISLLAAWAMILSHDPPGTGSSIDLRTWAEVVVADRQSMMLSVETQGTVEPRMEADLVAEVGGRVVEVASALEAGGFFAEGELLIRLDDRDYRNALARAQAVRDRARSELTVRTKARKRIESLSEQGLASESTLDDSSNAEKIAVANLAEAQSGLAKAELDLERAVVIAPFAGRVRDRHVGEGQFVMPGARLARIYATDIAEVRLPLSIDDLMFLEIPLAYSVATSSVPPPAVTLRADIGGRELSWDGVIVRTEGVLDPLTREVMAVAQVDDPFGVRGDIERAAPLAPGLFVRAEISGRVVDGVFELPSSAYRAGLGLLVVDGENRLRIRKVHLLRQDARRVYVTGGIEAGERVVVSALESPIDGMEMRVDAGAEPTLVSAGGSEAS